VRSNKPETDTQLLVLVYTYSKCTFSLYIYSGRQ